MDIVRPILGIASSFLGTIGVFGLMIAMNALDRGPKKPPARAAAQFDIVAPPKPPPPKRKVKPKPKPKPSNKPPPPTPILAA